MSIMFDIFLSHSHKSYIRLYNEIISHIRHRSNNVGVGSNNVFKLQTMDVASFCKTNLLAKTTFYASPRQGFGNSLEAPRVLRGSASHSFHRERCGAPFPRTPNHCRPQKSRPSGHPLRTSRDSAARRPRVPAVRRRGPQTGCRAAPNNGERQWDGRRRFSGWRPANL